MITGEDMMGVLIEMMPTTGVSDTEIDAKAKQVLSESGLDVDAVFTIANSIVHMAVQTGEPPEHAVVGAFVTGAALVCLLNKKGALQ